jgi:hypothetical protein
MSLFKLNNYIHYFYPLTITIILGIVYNKYKDHEDSADNINNYHMVKKYLLNDSYLVQNKKPIIWIHITYEKNARWWPNFSSRTTENLNQPYQYLTLKSIIDKCGEDFNVCLIDDDTFQNIIPGWNIDLSIVADPIRTKIRNLALARLLYNFGGFVMPSSFLCFKNMKQIYENLTINDNMFVGEMISQTDVSDKINFFPNSKFMGCKKNCKAMLEYIHYLEIMVSSDLTSESDFIGSCNRWFYKKNREGKVKLIPSGVLGTCNNEGKQITIDTLMSNNFINLSDNVHGLYIPSEEILKRTAYQWFARQSAKQALLSNTLIGKYLTINR